MRTGLDILLADPSRVVGQSVALATHPDCSTAAGTPILEALSSVVPVRVVAPEAPHLIGADLLLVDLPDGGLRAHPACDATRVLLFAAAEAGVPVLVLDRPNPLDGVTLEGPTVHPGFESAFGPAGPPLRHGLTPGELARFFVRQSGLSVDVDVLRCTSWHRDHDHSDTGLPGAFDPLVTTRTLLACTAWTVTSDLRFGAPGVDAHRLTDLCIKGAYDAELDGAGFTPVRWTEAGEDLTGVAVELAHPRGVHSFLLGLVLLEAAVRETAEARRGAFPWARHGNATARTPYIIDRVLGSPEGRLGLESRVQARELLEAWASDVEQFEKDRRPVLMY